MISQGGLTGGGDENARGIGESPIDLGVVPKH